MVKREVCVLPLSSFPIARSEREELNVTFTTAGPASKFHGKAIFVIANGLIIELESVRESVVDSITKVMRLRGKTPACGDGSRSTEV